MISVIIPAHNERIYLNRTIQNLFDTCLVEPEVLVVDQGGNGTIDPRARVITPGENVGERKAMNLAAAAATRELLFRIDAHCDFSPHGWDIMLAEVTGERDLTVAVLTATDKNWQREPGHWYGLCRLIVNVDEHGRKGLECKWQTPNLDLKYNAVEPNMGATGCGMMIRRKFYDEMGGADETLPKMGAIGEEFAIKAWAHGGKVQTRTDVMVGHIFGTGGYDVSGVKVAQQKLWDQYGHIYNDVAAKFPDFEGVGLVRTDEPGPGVRTVTVDRQDVLDTKGPQGQLIRRRIERYRYVWLATEHPDEQDWTDQQIELKYSKRGTKIGEDILYANEKGELIPAVAV